MYDLLRHLLLFAVVTTGLAFGATLTNATPAEVSAPVTSSQLPNGGKRKDCEELRVEIADRLTAKGVKNYTLRVVSVEEAATVTQERIVGSCNSGTGKILYKRG